MENLIRSLIKELNEAAKVYYGGSGEEIMSDHEYDEKFNRLKKLEQETGLIYPDSPTQKVGAEVVSELPEVVHEYRAQSLDKTKDIDEYVQAFKNGAEDSVKAGYISDDLAVLMWKMDGSTIQCTYEDGKLVLAATRGNNGEVGSDITHNAPYIKGLPQTIPFKGKVVTRGEAAMSYAEFERINADSEKKYKNPRNLATATIQMLDSKEMRKREIWFHAFNLVHIEDEAGNEMMPATFYERLTLLYGWGFNVVSLNLCKLDELKSVMEEWEKDVETYEFPVDGLVCVLNNSRYADTLPGTEHHPNIMRGYAFKWADDEVKTVLRRISWQVGRTGVLTPVAEFDAVEIEGTTVTRATLHNLSYIFDMDLKPGDTVGVIKCNMIIPAVVKNYSSNDDMGKVASVEQAEVRMDRNTIQRRCPVCGAETVIRKSEGSDTLVLMCPNDDCAAKAVRKFIHFCEKDCMNIDGMGPATIEMLVSNGFVREFADFWHLDRFKDEIVGMEGYGEQSYQKMMQSIEKARKTDFVSFVHALGIPNVGNGQAKLIKKHMLSVDECYIPIPWETRKTFFWDVFVKMCMSNYDFTQIEGIGDVINQSLRGWFADKCLAQSEYFRLLEEVEFTDPFEKKEADNTELPLAGKIFVITGDVHIFKNRAEVQTKIEELGGKVSGSVSAKTSYLINNDVASTSGKNKKAKELGIPVISEEQFVEMTK